MLKRHLRHAGIAVVAACLTLSATAAVTLEAAAQAGAASPGRLWADGALVRVSQGATLGPYATMRRALEVADQYRSRGFNANAYPDGGAYWVRVWR